MRSWAYGWNSAFQSRMGSLSKLQQSSSGRAWLLKRCSTLFCSCLVLCQPSFEHVQAENAELQRFLCCCPDTSEMIVECLPGMCPASLNVSSKAMVYRDFAGGALGIGPTRWPLFIPDPPYLLASGLKCGRNGSYKWFTVISNLGLHNADMPSLIC